MSALSLGFHVYPDIYVSVESHCIHVYCRACGGLRTVQLYNPEYINQASDTKAVHQLCTCRSIDEMIKIAIQHILHDVYQESEGYAEAEEVRQLVLHVASREEMRG